MADDSIFEGLDPEVAALLNQARATSPIEPNAGLIAAMSAAAVDGPLPIQTTSRRKTMLGKLITAKAAALAGALVLTGGVAAAATGTLPDSVQQPVHDAVDNVGLHIPAGDHGAQVAPVARHNEPGDDHGADVSNVARQNHGHGADDATDDDTTSTTVDDHRGGDNPNRGPGNNNSGGSPTADDHRGRDHAEDDDTTSTTITTQPGVTTPTTVDDHGGDNGNRGSGKGGGGENEPGHGGHGGDD